MARHFTVTLTSGTNSGPYTIYHTSIGSNNVAVLYGTTDPSENLTLTQVQNGVLVSVPDNATSVFLVNTNSTVQTDCPTYFIEYPLTANPTSTPFPTQTPGATPNPTPNATPNPTATPNATPEPTPNPTATQGVTPNPTETNRPTETPNPTATPNATPNPTETPSATPPPTYTPLPTASPTPTGTEVATALCRFVEVDSSPERS